MADIRAEITAKIIEALEAGVAPWQKPWTPGKSLVPHNAVTGRRYRGGNSLMLMMTMQDKGYTDARWLTFKQAKALNATIIKGEHGERVEYWQFNKKVVEKDENGGAVLDGYGNEVSKIINISPRIFYTTVFNAEQVDGLPPSDDVKEKLWNPIESAQAVADNCGVPIFHDQMNEAFYRPSADEIHMPLQNLFKTAENYYGTLLHEIAHSTGHESRLNRNLFNSFGSEEYAREELRAELASYFLSAELGVSHDSDNHAAYLKTWLEVLKKDKHEIFRASSDADRIVQYMLDRERMRMTEKANVSDLQSPCGVEEDDEEFGICDEAVKPQRMRG